MSSNYVNISRIDDSIVSNNQYATDMGSLINFLLGSHSEPPPFGTESSSIYVNILRNDVNIVSNNQYATDMGSLINFLLGSHNEAPPYIPLPGPVSQEYFNHLNDISMVTIKPALSHTITVSTLTGDVSAGYDYLGMFIKSTDESTQTLRAVGKVDVYNTAYYIHTMVVNRMWDEGEPTWVDASFSNVSYYHITDLCDNWLDSSGIKLDLTSQFNNNLGNLSDNDWWDISMDISMSGQSTCSRIL